MKKQEWDLSLSSFVCFTAALTIAVGQDIVYPYYRCKDFPISDTSIFEISCDAGKIIIVKSALIGATDNFIPPLICPITNNTCLKEITIVAELCTGRNICVISQKSIFNESQILCFQSNNRIGNFIIISYTCIVPALANYGDICYFGGDLNNNAAIYISSYPSFPGVMGPEVNYQCSCLLTSKSSSSSANVTIRALLVQLTGAITCSERLSIIDSENDTRRTFCSPCNNANNVITVPLASKSGTEILFRRNPNVSPFNGKFILEITVSSKPSGSSSIGSMKCSLISPTMSSSTTVSTVSPSYISTTTTSAILSQPNRFGSTNVQNTSSGMTMRSSNTSASSQQSTLSPSSNPVSETWNATLLSSLAPSSGNGTPTPASQIASDEKSVSTGGIIGIVLGSVGLIIIVIIVLLCLLRKQKQHRNHSKENTTSTVQQSATAIQNTQAINNIELHGTTSSELHTFQSAAHLRNDPQTTGYENNWQAKDNSMSNYEEGAAVSGATYGPGMIQANEQTRLSGDDLTTETQLLNSGDGDITLVENQLYGENEKPMTDVVASSDYAVVRPVVQDGRTDESAEVDRVYAVVQMKNNSADHSYYNVPGHAGSGTIQSPTEVSAEAETNSVSDEIETTNPMYKADSDVVLIDNTLYGSMLTF